MRLPRSCCCRCKSFKAKSICLWSDWRVARVSRLEPIDPFSAPRGPPLTVNRRRLRQHRGPAQYRNCAIRSKGREPIAVTISQLLRGQSAWQAAKAHTSGHRHARRDKIASSESNSFGRSSYPPTVAAGAACLSRRALRAARFPHFRANTDRARCACDRHAWRASAAGRFQRRSLR